jgi:plastocyanin
MEEIVPSVTVSDQDASGGTVTIEKVVADQPGWIVIHITEDGAPGPVIGQSPVPEGRNSNVEVAIDLDLATQQLFAMLHFDAGTEGVYEFPGDDAPVFDGGGNIVIAPFTLLEALASGGDEMVEVVDIDFRIKAITVPVGTTVTWNYDANLPHTVTSDTGLFNSGTMGEGDSFSYTFDEAGTFPYFCKFHGGTGGSGMSGIVNVTEG